jgi:hypothetical protein
VRGGWTARVEAPFRDDPRFWSSVGLSADAFWSLVVATVLAVLFHSFGAIAFVVPLLLLVVSARNARASTACTRPTFASRNDSRQPERQAVAAAMPGAFVRHVRRGHA